MKIGRISLIALVVWLAALAAAVYSSNAQEASMDRTRVVSAARALMPRPIGLKADPAPAETYRQIANDLTATNPNVEFLATPTGLIVRASDAGEYAAWMLAVTTAIAQASQYRWSIKELCAGTQCPSAPLSADLVAHQIQTEIK